MNKKMSWTALNDWHNGNSDALYLMLALHDVSINGDIAAEYVGYNIDQVIYYKT